MSYITVTKGHRTDGIYQCLYCKNLRWYPCCCNHLHAMLLVDRADIRQTKNRQTQNDKAKPHTARIVQNVFGANNVNALLWPAYSPDMYPIHNIHSIQLTNKHRSRSSKENGYIFHVIHQTTDIFYARRSFCFVVYMEARGGLTLFI